MNDLAIAFLERWIEENVTRPASWLRKPNVSLRPASAMPPKRTSPKTT
jgi:hypothetical protein